MSKINGIVTFLWLIKLVYFLDSHGSVSVTALITKISKVCVLYILKNRNSLGFFRFLFMIRECSFCVQSLKKIYEAPQILIKHP